MQEERGHLCFYAPRRAAGAAQVMSGHQINGFIIKGSVSDRQLVG